MSKKKILLDTDIGSDIDDAVCLAYLLRQPECELMGITTVSGQPAQRAKLASVMCHIAGRDDIPIYPGCDKPMMGRQLQPIAQQSFVLDRYEHREDFPDLEHISFMRNVIRANPHEITLLAIGPMTNVALLFALDPEIPSLLKELVLMCGVFFTDRPYGLNEWNAKCDPVATSIVYQAQPPIHRSVGIDVTKQLVMPIDDVKKAFKNDLLQVVFSMAEEWFKRTDKIIFHDPLTAAVLFNEDLCTFKRGVVDVDYNNTKAPGMMYWREKEDGPHLVAADVAVDKFFEHYFKIVNDGGF